MYFISAYGMKYRVHPITVTPTGGSTGSHGAQFFVNGMPVTLDYAKEHQQKPMRQEAGGGGGRVKTDWLCESVRG